MGNAQIQSTTIVKHGQHGKGLCLSRQRRESPRCESSHGSDDSHTFVVPLILSFLILSSFVTPHIHRSHFCDLQFLFLCLLQRPCLCPVHQCWSYHCSVHLPLDLHVHSPIAQHSRHSLPVLPPALHSVGDFRNPLIPS